MHTPTLSTTVPSPIIAISTAADWDHRSYSAKNTSVDEGIFKKGSMNMGEGIVVCFGS